ncbi:MAG: hypothetical protein NXH75_00185 [Halobacteriovoraceae bacterium]|nr:hypothetical protein [Halobacteriovoraceae bacterium]
MVGPKTLLRLNASPYQREDFFRKEKGLAESWNLNYLYFDTKERKISDHLPPPYQGPYIIISNTHTRPGEIPQAILDETQFWIHSNSGYDNFSASWVKEQTFPIFTGNPIRKESVTEYILGNLFSHFGRHPHQADWNKERRWERDLLSDQKILILGKGLIGESVGKSLSPLVRKVSFWDPFKKSEKEVLHSDLESLLNSHRVIILTASLNPTSMPLLDSEKIQMLMENFVLINSARGGLIDQEALINRLQDSPKAFAYLDVFQKEPFDKEFKKLKNVHLTSHIAGVFKELEDKMIQFESGFLEKFFKEGKAELTQYFSHLNLENRIHEDYLI